MCIGMCTRFSPRNQRNCRWLVAVEWCPGGHASPHLCTRRQPGGGGGCAGGRVRLPAITVEVWVGGVWGVVCACMAWHYCPAVHTRSCEREGSLCQVCRPVACGWCLWQVAARGWHASTIPALSLCNSLHAQLRPELHRPSGARPPPPVPCTCRGSRPAPSHRPAGAQRPPSGALRHRGWPAGGRGDSAVRGMVVRVEEILSS